MSESEIAVILNELKHIKADTQDIKRHVEKTNGRVTELEKWKNRLAGMWIATVVIFSVLWAIVTFVV